MASRKNPPLSIGKSTNLPAETHHATYQDQTLITANIAQPTSLKTGAARIGRRWERELHLRSIG